MTDLCPFCLIVRGAAPATIVREWDNAIAIVPLNPIVPGHVLVLPRRHVETFFSDPDVSAATMRRAAELLHGVERHHEPRDHNVITSAGPAATQTVMHLHVHIVPRQHGDGLALPWTSGWRRRLTDFVALTDPRGTTVTTSETSPAEPAVWCWFHEFSHPFDGISDGWACHAWGPNGLPDNTEVRPVMPTTDVDRVAESLAYNVWHYEAPSQGALTTAVATIERVREAAAFIGLRIEFVDGATTDEQEAVVATAKAVEALRGGCRDLESIADRLATALYAIVVKRPPLGDVERRFLDASVAVWRAIDQAKAAGPYRGIEVLDEGVRLRHEEAQAWEAYKAVLVEQERTSRAAFYADDDPEFESQWGKF